MCGLYILVFQITGINEQQQLEQKEKLSCTQCTKVYKSKSGLSRHMKSKHSLPLERRILKSIDLKVLIKKSSKKLSEDLCFPEQVRNEFSSFSLPNDDYVQIWHLLNPVFEKFNGSADKYFSQMHQFTQSHIFKNLSRVMSNLLLTEVSNNCLQFLTTHKTEEVVVPFQWSEKLKSIVGYLAGYCFRTVYSQIHRSKKKSFSHQCLAVLKAGKIDVKEGIQQGEDQSSKLINVKDRGGLWQVKKDLVRIFEVCEEHFYYKSQGFKNSFVADDIVSEVRKNMIVKSNFKSLYESVDLGIDKEVSCNLLEKLLLLYVRIRCHSYARKVKEDSKVEQKLMKQKSLRTEIKKSISKEK